jgi:hypothetical protein
MHGDEGPTSGRFQYRSGRVQTPSLAHQTSYLTFVDFRPKIWHPRFVFLGMSPLDWPPLLPPNFEPVPLCSRNIRASGLSPSFQQPLRLART